MSVIKVNDIKNKTGTGKPTLNGEVVWTDQNQGVGSGLDADLLDGYNLDANGVPLIRGFQPDGKVAEYTGDVNLIDINSVYNTTGSTPNAPEPTWGFITTYIHSGYSPSNAWRTQVWVGMQSENMYARTGNIDGTWRPWVRKVTTNDVIGVNQTWVDETANINDGVTYTNTTGKPILINAVGYSTTNCNSSHISMYVNGIGVATATPYCYSLISAIVPDNSTYKIQSGTNASISKIFILK